MADATLIATFIEESTGIIRELETGLGALEFGDAESNAFAVFAQRIDSIMGCAKTLGLAPLPELSASIRNISNLAEGCKFLGYRASQINELELRRLVAAFLAEALELIAASMVDLQRGSVSVDAGQAVRVQERLAWLSSKLKLSADDERAILKRFGLG